MQETREMLGEAAAISIGAVMQHHYLTIGCKIYRQTEGGSIGLDLTTEISSVYMSLWDEEFIKLWKHLGIQVDLYRRYIDDILMIMGEINPGWYFNTKKKILEFDPDHPTAKMRGDSRTFTIVKDMANCLNPQIQMTVDTLKSTPMGTSQLWTWRSG